MSLSPGDSQTLGERLFMKFKSIPKQGKRSRLSNNNKKIPAFISNLQSLEDRPEKKGEVYGKALIHKKFRAGADFRVPVV